MSAGVYLEVVTKESTGQRYINERDLISALREEALNNELEVRDYIRGLIVRIESMTPKRRW